MNSRRQFVQKVVAVIGTAYLTGVSQSALAEEERRRPKKDAGGGAAGDAGLPLVDPANDPMAKSVNYVEKHADLKKPELKTERQGVKFEGQYCKGCQLYTAAGKKGSADVGKCTLFSGKLVKADGWCASWSKKA